MTTPPTKGMVTRVENMKDASNSISSYATYDTYGNVLTNVDANGNTTTTGYDTTYHLYPISKTYPVTGLSESCTFDPGTGNVLSHTDVNGQVTTYQYDVFKRLIKVFKPGDDIPNNKPSIVYNYSDWGSAWVNGSPKQRLETWQKTTDDVYPTNYTWQYQFFDGLGRVIQTQAQSETTNNVIVSSTTEFNNRGKVDKQYVSQNIPSTQTIYKSPVKDPDPNPWKYSTPAYDALGRVVSQTAADGTTVSSDYTNVWQMLTTNELGNKTRYYYDAFQRLVKVEELNTDQSVYATTNYTYDTIGNLTQVVDAASNTTTMTYNWLARKTGMTDPDMGTWSYIYDNNGNLTGQTDAKNQTISMVYDAMNRLTNKNYPSGLGMTNVVYSYDSTTGGNYGKGLRTGMVDAMSDATHPSTYKYDNRGRLIQETRTEYSNNTWNSYTTSYTYDGLDRAVTVTYPTGETVTNTYNGRGLPNTVSGSATGNLVTGTTYNQLASITQINLGNGLKTNYSYWGIDHGTTAYGKLWEIKTQPQAGGTALQDMQYTWDAIGNLNQRQNLVSSETENFTYDFLDRLTGVSGAYTQSYTYNTIGNITSMNGNTYAYSTKPHAVTAAGSNNYTYDANGNMTTVLRLNPAGTTVTNSSGASNIADTTARLNGNLTNNGGENPTVHIYWGPTDGGTTAGNWAHDINLGILPVGAFYSDISSLTASTTYYYRCYAINSGGSSWATSTASFTTTATPIKLIGVDSGTTTNGSNPANYFFLQRFQAVATGNVNTFKFKASASGHVKVAIYNDNTGEPGTLLNAVNTSTAVVAGWNDIAIPATAVTSGTYYWLSYASDAAIGYYQSTTGATLRYKSGITYSSFTFPGTAGTGFTSLTNRVSLLAGWNVLIPVVPAVTNSTGASNVLDTTARLNGNLTNNGGENPTVHIYWGPADGGTTAGNWAHDINLGIKSVGTFYSDISGLTAGTTYYYRCYASNSGGNAWAGSSAIFTTSTIIGWDVENRVVAVSGGASFVYDGDGNRVKKTEGGQTILYINQYYEKNLTTSVVTTSYYLGGQLVAAREGTTLRYVHQDSLNSTSVMSTSTGTLDSSMTFFPFGLTRTGAVNTDKKFTGQRLDGTGLYYYNARYYDATIGRFISPDTAGQNPNAPQTLNRYSYCLNNPLNRNDPTGHWPNWGWVGKFYKGVGESLLGTLLSACPPYMFYTQTCQPLYQLATGQKSIQDFQTTPSQMINGIKNYYDVTTPEGLGHLTGLVIVILATAALGAEGAGGSTEAAVSDAENGIKPLLTASSRQVALKAIDDLPTGIQKSATSFFKDSATNQWTNFSIVQNTDGNYIIQATVPGGSPGYSAIYFKIVSPDGYTLLFGQDAFDDLGNLIHDDIKYGY